MFDVYLILLEPSVELFPDYFISDPQTKSFCLSDLKDFIASTVFVHKPPTKKWLYNLIELIEGTWIKNGYFENHNYNCVNIGHMTIRRSIAQYFRVASSCWSLIFFSLNSWTRKVKLCSFYSHSWLFLIDTLPTTRSDIMRRYWVVKGSSMSSVAHYSMHANTYWVPHYTDVKGKSHNRYVHNIHYK